MARRLVTTHAVLCDWHAALDSPQEIEATAQRTVHAGKTLDLCGFCALVWDFCGPRIDEIKEMIRPEVLEALLRSARSANDEEQDNTQPLQLAIQAEPSPRAASDEHKPKKARPGERIPGAEQVICPLPHRAGAPDPYWVRLRDRGSHAKGSHHVLGPEIDYKLPDAADGEAITLPVKCFEHQVCADAGGYGFKDDNGLRCHIIKSRSWAKAKNTDTTGTGTTERVEAA
ncbi:hypothetical protein [Streptomyces werraensis]|uniref:hypothetical protein n=1 Tax=Streptomyces werraensis TaxID=68284 RepID=UPI00344A623D